MKHSSVHWIGVGGTFTTTAALLQKIHWEDKSRVSGFRISRNAVLDAITGLAPMTISERNELKSIQPQRTDIVVHGLAILLACMDTLEITEIVVSECGNLEGYLKYLYC